MDAFAHLDPALGRLTRQQIHALQTERMLRMLPGALSGAGLVRDSWERAGLKLADVRSLEEFSERVPFMSQDAIRAYRTQTGDPCGGVSRQPSRRLSGIASTSGTTGNPTPVPLTPGSIFERTMTRDMAWCMGMQPGEFLSWMMFAFRGGLEPERYRALGITQISIDHLPHDIPLLIDASLRYRPTALFILSGPMILMIDQYARKHGINLTDVFSSYRGAVYGGERIARHLRELTDSWGLQLFELASLGDLGTTQECSAHDGFHGWEDFAMLEHLDPNGNTPVADGEIGELVVTALDDPAFTLVRYRTDDLVRLTREPCKCGLTHARFWILGRKGDEVKIGESSFFPKDLWPLVEEHHECKAALFQLGRGAGPQKLLRIKVGHDPALLKDSPQALKARLLNTLQDSLGIEVDVELVENDELLKLGPPHKIPRVFKL